ncbi:hypothetical protein [Acidithiobacillus sp.]|uniref:hypothetical protein n=1 Tax=Acidithiobacillus sp. TaxID=1872118 RepID=UPI003D01AD19
MRTSTNQQTRPHTGNHRRLGGDRYRDQVMSMVTQKGFTAADSTYQQDMHEASDLLLDGQGCALRIRAEKALDRWPDEFTIRAVRPGCTDTEFQKIMDGHARYALYGFADSTDKIVLLRLLDLNVFRTCILGKPQQYDRDMRWGTDGVGYLVFNIREFPETLVSAVWDYRH